MSQKLKLLVVCSRNKKRSLTAEKIYEKDQRFEIRSVGTSSQAKRKIKQSDIKWADIILCMEEKHYKMIQQLFGIQNVPLTLVLGIKDEYEFMDQELINMLKTEIEVILQR